MQEYTLIRSDRRTLALEITPTLEVLVRAPRRCSQQEIDRFVESHSRWLDKHLAIQKERQAAQQISPAEEQWLRETAAEELPRRVAHYAALMGLNPTSVKITSAQKRFGSCNSRGGLCFSFRLMQYPDSAIDYVVVHELAHLRHMNHGKAFYTLVARYMPDYKERQALLKSPTPKQ
ncbi:MAG: M48 family metallopeptidase [Clostridia bacterium]|nr:M48 family metallopeptidase [Clostridia bacterium]